MRGRLLVAVAGTALAVAAVTTWLARRHGDSTPTGVRAGAAAPTHTAGPPAPTGARASATRQPLRRRAATPPPTQTVTVGGVTFEGAGVYDPESEDVKANLLEFRRSRLRFALNDAAADCWDGGDDVADLQVRYTMVVEREVLRLENVTMVDSTLPDPAVERCILARLAELRAPATELGDLREDGSSWIALHDLYTRNAKRQR